MKQQEKKIEKLFKKLEITRYLVSFEDGKQVNIDRVKEVVKFMKLEETMYLKIKTMDGKWHKIDFVTNKECTMPASQSVKEMRWSK